MERVKEELATMRLLLALAFAVFAPVTGWLFLTTDPPTGTREPALAVWWSLVAVLIGVGWRLFVLHGRLEG